MIEKTLRMALLYDAYGSLLTEKQRDFFSLYYQDDLSLGEIAAQYGITRQAVYDILKRSESALNEFEARLGLLVRDEQTRARVERMQTELDKLLKLVEVLPPHLKDEVAKIIARLNEELATL